VIVRIANLAKRSAFYYCVYGLFNISYPARPIVRASINGELP